MVDAPKKMMASQHWRLEGVGICEEVVDAWRELVGASRAFWTTHTHGVAFDICQELVDASMALACASRALEGALAAVLDA